MKRIIFSLVLSGILAASIVLPVTAEEAAMPEMTEEQKAMMANMEAYSTPNENHQLLQSLAGTWDAQVKYWMDPNGEPQTSLSTGQSAMIMDGKFLEQTFTGDMMGQPFEGQGIYGYDNILKKFRGVWFDNVGTGIMVSSGEYDPTTKTIKEEGHLSCPMTNSDREFRSVTTFIDDNHYTYETFMNDENGKEYRSMVIHYTRKDASMASLNQN